MSEIKTLHEPFMRWLKERGIFYIRARSDMASTIERGLADFVLLSPFRPPVFIEFKTEKGKESAAQRDCRAKYVRAGFTWFLLRDIGTACEIAEAFAGNRLEAAAQPDKPRLTIRNRPGFGSYVFDGDKPLRRATIDDLKAYQTDERN